MNCRYCGGIYAASDRTCGGCGAPKTMVQTLLDVPAAPNHWSHSMFETVQRAAIVSVAIAIGAWLASLIGLETLGLVVALFWIMPLSVVVLGMGAWQSSIGNVQERIRHFIMAAIMWIGIAIAMLLVIGAIASE